jgi:pyruvate kinase
VGKYPVQSVEFMTRIALQAETSVNPWPPDVAVAGMGESVAHAACRAAEEQQAQAIVPFTQSGSTALLVSKHRPRMPIIAPTPFEEVARKVSLYWGLHRYPEGKKTTDDMITSVERIMLKKNWQNNTISS